MSTPVPTPFDIAAIPYFPTSPGLREWLIFVILAGVFLWITWWLVAQKPEMREGMSIERALRHDLSNLKTALEAPAFDVDVLKSLLAEFSLSARRALGHRDGIPYDTMSAHELEHLLRNAELEQRALSSGKLLDELLVLEHYKYLPAELVTTDRARMVAAVDRVSESLDATFKGRT